MCDIKKIFGMDRDIPRPPAREADAAKKGSGQVKSDNPTRSNTTDQRSGVVIADPVVTDDSTNGKVRLGAKRVRKGVPGLSI